MLQIGLLFPNTGSLETEQATHQVVGPLIHLGYNVNDICP